MRTRYHPYLVSMLFADLLSLHVVTFLMFFILVNQYWIANICPALMNVSLKPIN